MNPKIMIVDDVEANVMLLNEILEAYGYEVIKAYSGPEALKLAPEHHPSLILLDIMMPEMDGLEVCRRLKAQSETKHIPIIFITALSDSHYIVKGFEAGGVDYISKPLQMREVLARVETHLQLEQQRRSLQDSLSQLVRLQKAMNNYLSKSARESIEDAVFGEAETHPVRKTLTIMFTDIANFTTISEAIATEELITDLTVYMALLAKIIHEHHGQIDKFLGDGIMAFFEDAGEALRASYEIQILLDSFNNDQSLNEHPRFDTRIGLATGTVILAELGFDNRREFTIVGDRVNTAARLQSQAPLCGVLMDEQSYQAAALSRYSGMERYNLKGKQQSETAYSIEYGLMLELLQES